MHHQNQDRLSLLFPSGTRGGDERELGRRHAKPYENHSIRRRECNGNSAFSIHFPCAVRGMALVQRRVLCVISPCRRRGPVGPFESERIILKRSEAKPSFPFLYRG